ncbi:multiple C2 and transmembrane domain-containing protein 2 isoform X2 [Takifugu flavidus]|uniref:multiple C2 and transmembrane domain-containing protein 2 isoform X2 n=1 Tax=Takifugu flavidus TaxID=433684 RepID=UPI002544C005|nr:multiple C2 and transmembrane domain-containing protein 2 isoform X2 [Takifugu flavidus]
MEVKKKNFLGNLRQLRKLGNPLKQRKKGETKPGRMLAHRRSISVPNLTLVPGEAFSLANAPEGLYFGMSPGVSDSDSIASCCNTDGGQTAETDGPYDSVSETGVRVRTHRTDGGLNRISAPVGALVQDQELKDGWMDSEDRVSSPPAVLYAQVQKRVKEEIPRFTFDPIPTPRSVFPSTPFFSPKPEVEERGRLYSENTPANSISTALVRPNWQGEQVTVPKRSSPCEQRQPSERGTPPVMKKAPTDRMYMNLDGLGTPLESADGTSLDSACGTSSEERVNLPWMTDSEDLDRDLCSPLFMKDLSAEEARLEQLQAEEAAEDLEMSSEQLELYCESVIDPLENSGSAAGVEVQAPQTFQRYVLNINLKQGRNLAVNNKRSGTSDPYVKFKLDGKQFYKSKVVYKSLNPRWNESLSYPLRDIEHTLDVRVYNKNRTADEFMGSSSLYLKDFDLYKTYEMELQLEDPKSKEDDVGLILVDLCLMFRDATIKKGPKWAQKKNKNQAAANQRPPETPKNQSKNRMWTGVLGITLVEGQDLPQYGQGDIYVRFRLGDQKYKSKNLCIQANPQWREQFDFNQFDDNQEPLQVEVFSKRGRKAEESWGMFEIDLSRVPINERQLYNHGLDPGKGRLVCLVTLRPCWGVSISDIEAAPLERPDERDSVEEKFSLKNSHRCVHEVGFLQVKVIRANDLPATDLNGKSNPFCVVELGNSKLQTHTVYKTLNPEWSKAFTLPIKDIHSVIQLTVLDENGDKAPSFLGKVAIPLLTVQSGQQVCLLLKKEELGCAAKGTITLVLEVIYNKVRAGIRTFQPKESDLTEESAKFSKKVLAQNIFRVRKISTAVLHTLRYINSCFQWESTQRSLIAFLDVPAHLQSNVQNSCGAQGRRAVALSALLTVQCFPGGCLNPDLVWQLAFEARRPRCFTSCLRLNWNILFRLQGPEALLCGAAVVQVQIFLVTVWHWELFMLPLFLLLILGWQYFQLTTGNASSNQEIVNMSMGDEEEEDEKDAGKKGLMEKIHMVQEVVLVVQNVLEELANIGERIKNMFNWSVPFLSCLACSVLFVAMLLLYFIPLRYLVLIWGVNKFTKKLRNPYTIDNNEILNFLKRVPTDVQKVQYSALRAPTSQIPPRRKK